MKRYRREKIRMGKRIDHPAVRCFSALYKKCDQGYINLRFIPSGENHFVQLSEIEHISGILKEIRGQNAHLCVATRQKGNGTKEGILQISASRK
jgi:hypothetical protein